MIKKIVLSCVGVVSLFAVSQFESSQTCKVCHPVIYQEHFSSAHRQASIYSDAVHKAIWDKHPAKKKEKYKCAKCHTPNDKEIISALKSGASALPKDNKAQKEGVSCASCHNIKDVEVHAKANKNIITTSKKKLFSAREGEKTNSNKSYTVKTSMFGMVTEKSGSPFHDIDFTNEIYYNGKVCTGCHSHKQNSHQFDVCNMDLKNNTNDEKENCITCHMPEVQGSFSTSKSSKTHRYHGFVGSMHKPHLLAKYVEFKLSKTDNGFDITVVNKANHDLLLHPLRVGELRVSIMRDKNEIKLNPVKFIRAIGKDSKPSMPWVATEIVKNTQIKAKESRVVHFDTQLKSGDSLEIRLGHYIVNPKAAKKLGLTEHKNLSKFTLFKKENISIK
jgi:hypothetical protein